MKEILFKGFRESGGCKEKAFINSDWVIGDWIEGYVYYTTMPKKVYAFITTLNSDKNIGYSADVIPETVSQFIGLYCTKDKNSKIFENDIVEITLHSGTKYRYLIWFCQEVCEVTAIDIEYIKFNGVDYHEYHGNDISIGEFSVMIQDHYGHIKEVKVIGNIFDNPELLIRKENKNG